MGFNLEYLNDGTVKGVIDLKNMDVDGRCLLPKISPKVVAEEQQIIQASEEKRDIKEHSEVAPS
jgi:hypothetical protein